MSHPTGVVLAGGSSRRMGADKALLTVDGRPMALRVADALWEAGCNPVWCQGGDPVGLGAIGIEVVPDESPGAGPVPAILTALRRAGRDVVVAACDLTDLTSAIVRQVAAARPDRGVAVAVSDGRAHLLSAWSSATEPALAELVAAGTVTYRDVVRAIGAVEVEVPPASMRNVNGPDDLG